MKQIQMTDQELIAALKRMAPETGSSLLCLGCGHEHNCSIHGCVVLREAVKRLEDLAAPPPNPPLTLEELREMGGEPVWIVSSPLEEWNIIHSFHQDDVVGGGVIMTRRTAEKRTYPYTGYRKTWFAYRRKPEEGTNAAT